MINKYKLSLISILALVLCSCATNSVGNHVNNAIKEENDLIEIENNHSNEPREIIHVEENVVDRMRPIDATFTVVPVYGKYLNIAVKNYSKAELVFIIYKDGGQIERNEISSQGDKTVKLNVDKQVNYRVLIEVANGTNGGKFSASVRARQYN